jgi:hypothetical protein
LRNVDFVDHNNHYVDNDTNDNHCIDNDHRL